MRILKNMSSRFALTSLTLSLPARFLSLSHDYSVLVITSFLELKGGVYSHLLSMNLATCLVHFVFDFVFY